MSFCEINEYHHDDGDVPRAFSNRFDPNAEPVTKFYSVILNWWVSGVHEGASNPLVAGF